MSKKRSFNLGDKDSRKRRACERLGTESPTCLLCGEKHPLAIQLHHVAGSKFHGEVSPVCLNHHAVASDFQKDHPAKIECCTNPLEAIGHLLMGLADLAEIAANELRDPMLCDFLMYLRNKLKEVGILLIGMARRVPDLDFGITP